MKDMKDDVRHAMIRSLLNKVSGQVGCSEAVAFLDGNHEHFNRG